MLLLWQTSASFQFKFKDKTYRKCNEVGYIEIKFHSGKSHLLQTNNQAVTLKYPAIGEEFADGSEAGTAYLEMCSIKGKMPLAI